MPPTPYCNVDVFEVAERMYARERVVCVCGERVNDSGFLPSSTQLLAAKLAEAFDA